MVEEVSEPTRVAGAHHRPLLRVDDVKTWFRAHKGVVHAVDGVSFSLEQGETIGVVGESGSGKSVLARTIMRLLPPTAITSGSVTFGGRDLTRLPDDAARSLWGNEIAMVFQNPLTSLNPVMRVGRQITEVLVRHRQFSESDARDRAVDLLRLVGIAEPDRRIRDYPHQMSGGMRQRVCIAIAIACSPRLLLADEPTTALDVTIQHQILDLMDSLREQSNMSIVLITHDLGVVAGRTDRVIVMYGGKIVETAPTVDLFDRPRHPYTSSLLAAIPRIASEPHRRLAVIPGRPVDIVGPKPGCRFAPRCARAQDVCTSSDPPLVPSGDHPGHHYACFFPNGSADGAAALAHNRAVGHTAAGLTLPTTMPTAGAGVNG